jgi:hypothetical protein
VILHSFTGVRHSSWYFADPIAEQDRRQRRLFRLQTPASLKPVVKTTHFLLIAALLEYSVWWQTACSCVGSASVCRLAVGLGYAGCDRCQIPIGPINSGEVYVGSTVDATGDVVGACHGASQSRAPGVWCTMLGTGERLVAETCVGIPELEGDF